ncbi:MAG: SusC/RagA family TonB-linked outer membrane protein [Bacteroidetes bacterium]|nr:SusC/RagA family TonB-linked outer membrane protein [Bacteroidota bacterium]
MKKFLLLCFSFGFALSVWAQDRVVTGKLTSKEDQSALPGVNVVLKGTTNGTVTDADGNYKLTVPSSGGTLVFSFIGFATQEVAIGERNVIDISLGNDVTQLSEVVVSVAGGLQAKQKELGTANTVVNTATLMAGKTVSVAGGLQGKVAGLQINATDGGVNPNYSVVLRGSRSMTGNNQALIVLDGVLVPSSVLSNLNGNDIESINIQKGAGAAAIYGSMASNGVLIITTKRGHKGGLEVTASNNTQFQQVAFLPKFQTKFGAGGTGYGINGGGIPGFSQYENQSYGPAFDGSQRPLGPPQENGYQEYATYSYVKNAHSKFWEIGSTNQTDVSFSSSDDKSSIYVSGQYVTANGTTPGDHFTRANLRVNGSRKISDNLKLNFSMLYAPNTYDISSATATIYDNMLNMPGNVDVAKYKNWQAQGFGAAAVGNPNNFYNPWYGNPYFTAANNREKDKNNYLTGNVEVKFAPIKGLEFTVRQGITARQLFSKQTTGAFHYSDYAKGTWNSSKTDIPGTDYETSQYTIQAISDFYAQYNKAFGNFNLNVVGGMQLIQNQGKYMTTYIGGLVVPGLYNLSNGTGNPSYSQAEYTTSLVGGYMKASLTYKDWLTLTGTGRNDWDSRLNVTNRSFFYPSGEVAAVLTDALPSLKDNGILNFLKVRGSVAKVGQVNLPANTQVGAYTYNLNGAYKTAPVFDSNQSNGSNNGFPYGTLAGYSLNNQLVSGSIKPEFTQMWEAGFDANLWQDKVQLGVTYFSSKTNNQTISTSVSGSTGFTSLLTNVGQTSNSGLEMELNVTPIKTSDWTVSVGGNWTYLTTNVDFISSNVPSIILQQSSAGAIAVSQAIAGKPFPVIMGTDYQRDKQGRVIVDATTGLPSITTANVYLGNATPKNRIGANTKISYKGLSFSILFEYRGGYQIYNGIGPNIDWSGTGARSAEYDRRSFVFPNSVYSLDGGNTYIPNKTHAIANGDGNGGFWSDTNRGVSSNYVTSGSFIKLREISLSYDLTPIFSKLGTKLVKGATISVQGRNLFLWMAKDNYYADPEYNSGGNSSSQAANGTGLNSAGQTPPVRYFGGTLNLRF